MESNRGLGVELHSGNRKVV